VLSYSELVLCLQCSAALVGRQQGIQPVKNLVCWWWWFDANDLHVSEFWLSLPSSPAAVWHSVTGLPTTQVETGR